jgi:hypothetical protein
MSDFISTSEAAALLAPVTGKLDPHHLLTDWRRASPRYTLQLRKKPKFVRHGGQVFYPRSEIMRAIDEIGRYPFPI